MKMKILFLMLLLLIPFAIAQAHAQEAQTCVTPSWVSTAATAAWMPTVCSTITIHAYDASDGMKLKPVTVTVLGYWDNLVYAQTMFNPFQVWLLDQSVIAAH